MTHSVWVTDYDPVPLSGADIISAQVFAMPPPYGVDPGERYLTRRDAFIRKMDDAARGLMPWEDPVC